MFANPGSLCCPGFAALPPLDFVLLAILESIFSTLGSVRDTLSYPGLRLRNDMAQESVFAEVSRLALSIDRAGHSGVREKEGWL